MERGGTQDPHFDSADLRFSTAFQLELRIDGPTVLREGERGHFPGLRCEEEAIALLLD
jgi:hypothetical protein